MVRPQLFGGGHVSNAAAAPGEGTLHVNVDWLADQFDLLCNDGTCTWELAIGILGHELGHLRDGYDPRNAWHYELRADSWAGQALALAGVSTENFCAMLNLLSAYPSETHPPAHLRIDAMCAGYSMITGATFRRVA